MSNGSRSDPGAHGATAPSLHIAFNAPVPGARAKSAHAGARRLRAKNADRAAIRERKARPRPDGQQRTAP
jgi:hypothetical protein